MPIVQVYYGITLQQIFLCQKSEWVKYARCPRISVVDSCELWERIQALLRKVRDMAMIVTFLLTGARLREIVHLDRGDIDLHQSTIRLHRKGGEVNVLPSLPRWKLRTTALKAVGSFPSKDGSRAI